MAFGEYAFSSRFIGFLISSFGGYKLWFGDISAMSFPHFFSFAGLIVIGAGIGLIFGHIVIYHPPEFFWKQLHFLFVGLYFLLMLFCIGYLIGTVFKVGIILDSSRKALYYSSMVLWVVYLLIVFWDIFGDRFSKNSNEKKSKVSIRKL
jgi:hypothetical protein